MMEVPRSNGLFSLPNEILCKILFHYSTPALLRLTTINKNLHNLIVNIIHQRLLSPKTHSQHAVLLECFHPSMRLTTPHLSCLYISTAPLSSNPDSSSSSSPNQQYKSHEPIALQTLQNLYTSFTILKPPTDQNTPRPHPAGGFFTPITSLSSPSFPATSKKNLESIYTQQIHLESHELFTQLCTKVKVVKKGPVTGVFRSCVDVGEGTVRVWRDWLGEMCDDDREWKGEEERGGVLWVDVTKDVGLRVRVERVVDHDDETASYETSRGSGRKREKEDCDVAYILYYEELIIRSTRLLLQIEQARTQESQNSGKAIIIGSWN